MKKYTKLLILLISTLFLVLSCVTKKNTKKNDIENLNLIGKVKSIKIINYEILEKNREINKDKNLKDYQSKTLSFYNKCMSSN